MVGKELKYNAYIVLSPHIHSYGLMGAHAWELMHGGFNLQSLLGKELCAHTNDIM